MIDSLSSMCLDILYSTECFVGELSLATSSKFALVFSCKPSKSSFLFNWSAFSLAAFDSDHLMLNELLAPTDDAMVSKDLTCLFRLPGSLFRLRVGLICLMACS